MWIKLAFCIPQLTPWIQVKSTSAVCVKCAKLKDIIDFSVLRIFQPIWTCSGSIIYKRMSSPLFSQMSMRPFWNQNHQEITIQTTFIWTSKKFCAKYIIYPWHGISKCSCWKKDAKTSKNKIHDTSGNHVTTLATVGHEISERQQERYFWYHCNCKQHQVEVRNSISNRDIYFPLFSEITHIQFWKYFYSKVLYSACINYCKR